MMGGCLGIAIIFVCLFCINPFLGFIGLGVLLILGSISQN